MRLIKRLLLFVFLCLPASAIVLTVNWSDFSSVSIKGKLTTVTPDDKQTNGTYVATLDTRSGLTDTNGSISFTNVIPNGYTIDLNNFVHTHFHITITNGTPTNATLNAKDLITVATNSGFNAAYPMALSDAKYAATITNSILWVDPNGSDTTGRRGRSDKPFATPKAAVTAASAGDAVVVFPGLYTNQNNLGKNMVNIFTYPGATISYLEQTTNGLGRGFFDDRDGVLTNIVAGYGTWKYSCGTNGSFDEDTLQYFGNPNTQGAIVLTNYASSLKWQSGDCFMGNIASDDKVFFNLSNSMYCSLEFDQLWDLYPNGVTVATPDIGPQAVDSHAGVLYWSSSEFPLTFNHIHDLPAANGLWFDEQTTSHTNYEGETWIKGNLIECKIYITGKTPTWRTWWDVSEVKIGTHSSSPQAWNIAGPGKHYVRNQKSESRHAGNVLSIGGTTNKDDLSVWWDGDAMKSDTQWISIGSGTFIAIIKHFEDTGINGGTVDEGIKVSAPGVLSSNAFVNITGITMTANNGRPIALYGGTNVFTGLQIRSTNNTCVYATNGYNLFNGCLLISKTTSNAIDSGAVPVNVGFFGGGVNRPKGANVTISPGTLTVDSNLR